MLCPPLIGSEAHEDGGPYIRFCDFRLEYARRSTGGRGSAVSSVRCGDGTEEIILQIILRSVPLAKTMAEQIEALRSWAKTRAQNATSAPKRPSSKPRKIVLDPSNN